MKTQTLLVSTELSIKRIKVSCIIVLLASTGLPAVGQKELLTKDETISYLEKKIKEVIEFSHHQKFNNGETLEEFFVQAEFAKSGSNVSIYEQRSNTPVVRSPTNRGTNSHRSTFNPKYIESFDKDLSLDDTDAVGFVAVKFSGKLSKYEFIEERWQGTYLSVTNRTVDDLAVTYFPYLRADPKNYDRIVKALQHLSTLYKAEEDPFDN